MPVRLMPLRLCACILVVFTLLAGPGSGTSAQGPDQVAVVVQYAEGSVSTHCVALDTPQITGLEALQRTRLEVVSEGGALGARVCKIGPVGCDLPGDCFCQCKGQECLYWSYWHLVDGTWQYAIVGAASYQVVPGSVEGWSWGIGTPNRAPHPPLTSFEQICAPPTAPPTGTIGPAITPSPTAMPTHTATPVPSPTVRPTGTAHRTATPSSTPTQAPAAEELPSSTPTQPAPTSTPGAVTPQPAEERPTETPAPVPTPAPPGPGHTNYVYFGAIVLVLLALGAYVLLRRR